MLDQLAQGLGVRRCQSLELRRRVAEPDLPPIRAPRAEALGAHYRAISDDRSAALGWLVTRLRWERRLTELEQAHAAHGGPIRPAAVERSAIPAASTHGG